MNLFNKSVSFLLYTLPALYGIYMFIRVIIPRAPRDIMIIDSTFKLFLITCVILGLALRIYVQLKGLEIIPKKEPKNAIIKKIKNWVETVNDYIKLIKMAFFRKLTTKFESYGKVVLWLFRVVNNNITTVKFRRMVFILEIGTKVTVVIIFLVDVFYFKQINYFYKVFGLLLIPLITDLLLFAMMLFHSDNIKAMIGLLDSKPIPDTKYDEFCFYDETWLPNFVLNVDDFVENHLLPVFDFVYNLAIIYEIRKNYNFNLILLLITIVYMFTWLYILLVGLGIL